MAVFGVVIFSFFSLLVFISKDLKKSTLFTALASMGLSLAIFFMGSELLSLLLLISSVLFYFFQLIYLRAQGAESDRDFSQGTVLSVLVVGLFLGGVLYFLSDLKISFLLKDQFVDYSKVSNLIFEDNYLVLYLLLLLVTIVVVILGFLMREEQDFD